MHYISTRLKAPKLNFKEVILQGLAADGGLYIPETLPHFEESDLQKMRKMDYEELFFTITKDFIGGEISDDDYREIIAKSYKNFVHEAIAPLKQIAEKEFLLELFHGPTLAFKDFALQFLGNLLDYLLKENGEKIVIIGATSGDTGSAAINGCMKCDNAQIFILHPHQKVSAIQRKQMTTIKADNVFNIAVEGNFDDCQNFVKKMFADQSFLKGKRMVAVNSINWARIMAQIVYYFYAGLRLGACKGSPLSFTVPTGNFGDIYAGFLAKKMGLAVKKLIVATNSNDILTRFIDNNDYSKEEMVETISPSMNIQVSSNFERMLFDMHFASGEEAKLADLMANFEKNATLQVENGILAAIKESFASYSIDDKATKAMIKRVFDETGEILDPHTAIGVAATREFMASEDYEGEIVVDLATAHPAKFPDAVVDSGVKEPELPAFLQGIEDMEEDFVVLDNDLEVVKGFVGERV